MMTIKSLSEALITAMVREGVWEGREGREGGREGRGGEGREGWRKGGRDHQRE